MAFRITAACINCRACEPLCPTGAITAAQPHFRIDAERCQECQGYYPEPQCAGICPVEGAILDSRGVPLNPAGSLTGIPAIAKSTDATIASDRAEHRA
ncbi:MAG: 4Fe-4S binding protein [Candidatus Competibacteraceae bacterium]